MKKSTRLLALLVALTLGLATATTVAQGEKPAQNKPKAAAKEKAKVPLKPVDINSANEKELVLLPGVGPALAKQIIAARPFNSVEDLKKVKGIGDKKFDMLKAHVVVNPPK